MTCHRCLGLMVVDHLIDMEESGGLWMRAWRCVSCGEVIDPKIVRHRIRPPSRLCGVTRACVKRAGRVREAARLIA